MVSSQQAPPVAPRRGGRRSRRDEVLAAATRRFSRHGYTRTALADIAADAGLSQAAVLYHFATKQDLLWAVVEANDAVDAPSALGMPAQGLDGLRQVITGTFDDHATNRIDALYLILEAENLEPDAALHDYLVMRSRYLRTLVVGCLRTAADRGEIDPGTDIEGVALELSCTLVGITRTGALDPDTVPIAETLARWADRAIDRLRTTAPEETNP